MKYSYDLALNMVHIFLMYDIFLAEKILISRISKLRRIGEPASRFATPSFYKLVKIMFFMKSLVCFKTIICLLFHFLKRPWTDFLFFSPARKVCDMLKTLIFVAPANVL